MKKKTNELIQLISVAEAGDGFIRFSNGLQICYGVIVGLTQIDGNHNNETIIFSKPFSDTPAITVSRIMNYSSVVNELKTDIWYSHATPSEFILYGYDEADAAKVINFSYIAIGKWK